MKRYMFAMLACVLFTNITVHDLHAGRRSTLQAVCAGVAYVTAQASIFSMKRKQEYKRDAQKASGLYLGSIFGGLILGTVPYCILSRFTADARLEKAYEKLERILEETVLATKLPDDRESCVAMLQGMYTGDLWLFQAVHRLQLVQDDLVKIIDDIADARKKAAGDTTFVMLCDAAAQRAARALRNISVGLRHAHIELQKQSDEFHAVAECNA